MATTKWDDLHTTDQIEYLEWMETLQCQDHLPMDIDDDEFMAKMIRMYNCDVHQGFDPDDIMFLDDLDDYN
jgi:hypothetical protein